MFCDADREVAVDVDGWGGVGAGTATAAGGGVGRWRGDHVSGQPCEGFAHMEPGLGMPEKALARAHGLSCG